jgi:putative transposase
MGLTVLKTPVRVPQANAFCERLIGTIRRECLDFMIPMSERHVRAILRERVPHYNRDRPLRVSDRAFRIRHRVSQLGAHQIIDFQYRVTAAPILGGLRHEYRLERQAA